MQVFLKKSYYSAKGKRPMAKGEFLDKITFYC